MLAEDRRYYFDATGCGNTVNLRHPRVLQMVMDSLRYWVEDCHVDGFRFDLATSLGREYDDFDPNAGLPRRRPPGPGAAAREDDRRALGRRPGRLPASATSRPAGPSGTTATATTMRSFWKGDGGMLPDFARGVLGSADLFDHHGRKPWASVNFVTAHDGFTLTDLWSYNDKHNEANGEDNRDGHDDNRSWNCGVEGPTDDPAILDLRDRHAARHHGDAAPLAGHADAADGRRDRPHAGRQQQRLLPGQRDRLAGLERTSASATAPSCDFVRGLIALRKRYPLLRASGTSCTASRSTGTARATSSGSARTAARWTATRGATATPRWSACCSRDAEDAAPHPRQRLPRHAAVHAAGRRGDGRWQLRVDTGRGADRPDRTTPCRWRGRRPRAAARCLLLLRRGWLSVTERSRPARGRWRASSASYTTLTGETVARAGRGGARAARGDGHRLRRRRARSPRASPRLPPVDLRPVRRARRRPLPHAGLAPRRPRLGRRAASSTGSARTRNWGIGDFEDLGRFAEIAAAAGADFLGVNPLHALFLAAPERLQSVLAVEPALPQPALHRGRPGARRRPARRCARPARRRSATAISSTTPRSAASSAGRSARLWPLFEAMATRALVAEFHSFVAEEGESLYLHALFEALSETMVAGGARPDLARLARGVPHARGRRGAGPSRPSSTTASCSTASCNGWRDRQLAEAQHRARAAGMRIGLYLDFAVGVAPDGSATWSDRALLVPGARIGAPPDYFNAAGQDWGLSPLSPPVLAERALRSRSANALDTVLAPCRCAPHRPRDEPLPAVLDRRAASPPPTAPMSAIPSPTCVRTVAERLAGAPRRSSSARTSASCPTASATRCTQADIQSYRVLLLREARRPLPARRRPIRARRSPASPPTTPRRSAGWWSGHDLDVRAGIGMIGAEALAGRARGTARTSGGACSDCSTAQGLLPPELAPVMRGEAEPPLRRCRKSLAVALHRLHRAHAVAAGRGAGRRPRRRARAGQHPRHRRRAPELAAEARRSSSTTSPRIRCSSRVTAALREERPKPA